MDATGNLEDVTSVTAVVTAAQQELVHLPRVRMCCGGEPLPARTQTGTAIAGTIPCNHRSYMSVA